MFRRNTRLRGNEEHKKDKGVYLSRVHTQEFKRVTVNYEHDHESLLKVLGTEFFIFDFLILQNTTELKILDLGNSFFFS